MTRLDPERREARAESQPHHRDTPPEDVYIVEAGLLAHGSMLLSGLPETFRVPVTSLDSGSPLTVAGAAPALATTAAPASLLASESISEEPRPVRFIDKFALQSTDHFRFGISEGTMV